ncbi:hypothetical protein GGS20DRAFT_589389 [Poronia punctata]|nr:hypothetical protein GGS20DRAFT_589389 [Poronia punctata]
MRLSFSASFVAGICISHVSLAATLHSAGNSLPSILRDPKNNWSSGTSVSFPGDGVFADVTERWTVYKAPTFDAAVTPYTEKDVVEAVSQPLIFPVERVHRRTDNASKVELARAYNTSFLATGGRHGYGTSLGKLQGGLSIDLGQLNSVHIDKKAGLLTVGGGVRFRDIVDLVYNAGFEIQTGTCSCPGMVGVTVGAGIGRLAGIYGLLIDALVSARMVTADGVLEVSSTKNPEFFGGDPDGFTSFDFVFSADKNVTYFNAIQNLIHSHGGSSSMPARLSTSSALAYNTTINEDHGIPLKLGQ